MNSLQRIWDLFAESLRVFGEKFTETIPSILGAIIVFVIAWLLARLVSGGFERLLRTVKFDAFAERLKLTNFLQQAGIQLAPSTIIGRFIYWILVLLIISSAAETLNWTSVSYQIQRFLEYLPNLITGMLIFGIGAYIATLVRDFVRSATGSLGISTGRILSAVIYYVLFIMVILTALEQAKVDTRLLSTNLLMIIGAILLAASISYGFASREVLSNILAGFFNKRNFHKGMTIEIDGIRGVIVEMSNVAVTIQVSDSERVVIPSHQLMTSKVKIIKEN
ncbi:MAG: mechanosensitive ion channel [Saprospiraceae bacterium]|nr:mechanosensitive ion channel [Saprospiraceae bacterium]